MPRCMCCITMGPFAAWRRILAVLGRVSAPVVLGHCAIYMYAGLPGSQVVLHCQLHATQPSQPACSLNNLMGGAWHLPVHAAAASLGLTHRNAPAALLQMSLTQAPQPSGDHRLS